MDKFIIIVAGGTGTRMNSAVPKQYIELNGKPILMHTIEIFAKTIPEIKIIVVLAKQLNEEWKSLCNKHNFNLIHQLAEGGETRFQSVKNALVLVPEGVCVGIHDAARPFVSSKTIISTFETAEKYGNAIPTIPLSDTIRLVKGKESCAVDRTKYNIIQTPQCFHSNLIKRAFLKTYQPEFTDDATVLEGYGEKINLIEGNRENIKITTPQDVIFAEAMMKNYLQ